MVPDSLSPPTVALAVDAFFHLPTPVAAFSGLQGYAFCNDAWRHYLGSGGACQPRDIATCLHILGVGEPERAQLIERLSSGCGLEGGPEIPIRLPDGRNRLLQFGSAPLPDGGLCIAAVDVTERRREEEETERMAYIDALTGLPNRRLFDDRLQQAIERLRRGHVGFAVHFLDLDRFKQVNDSFGHAAGDHLLRQVARRLLECVRRSDTVARFGGDEFGVIQTDIGSPEAAAALAGKLVKQLAKPFRVADHVVETAASIGVAVAQQSGDVDAARLMQAADIALYRVKRSGRGTYSFATEEELGRAGGVEAD